MWIKLVGIYSRTEFEAWNINYTIGIFITIIIRKKKKREFIFNWQKCIGNT